MDTTTTEIPRSATEAGASGALSMPVPARSRASTGDGARRRQGSRLVRLAAVGVVAAISAAGLAACNGGGSYSLRAVFANAGGLYPGNAVDVLGVPVGTVTAVTPQGSTVLVSMRIGSGYRLPATVDATLTNPQVLGTPSVDLSPGYAGGPVMAAGGAIPESRTVVPVSINRLLLDLQQVLHQVDPNAVGGVVQSLSQDLAGQGRRLNQLIGRGAGTLQLLADKGNTLGQLSGSLAAVTGTLRRQTSQVTTLLQDYDTVAGVLSANSAPLGQAIDELAVMSQDLTAVLAPNVQPLQQDIATITQLGRTLDRNLPTLDQAMAAGDSLFSAAQRAYDPTANWINLNLQLAPGLTAATEVGLIRDRLAGICRRLAANHAGSFTATVLQTLQTCGNPGSGFFDPLLGVIPQLLDSGSLGGSSAQQLLAAGVARIPGLSPSQRSALSAVTPGQLAGTGLPTGTQPGVPGTSGANPAGAGGVLHPAPPVPVPSSGGGLLGGLLHGLLGTIGRVGDRW